LIITVADGTSFYCGLPYVGTGYSKPMNVAKLGGTKKAPPEPGGAKSLMTVGDPAVRHI